MQYVLLVMKKIQMNDRIKQLAKQAGMIIVDDEFSTYGKFAEKFAELIIEECHYVMVVGGVDDLDVVLKHFGVEE